MKKKKEKYPSAVFVGRVLGMTFIAGLYLIPFLLMRQLLGFEIAVMLILSTMIAIQN